MDNIDIGIEMDVSVKDALDHVHVGEYRIYLGVSYSLVTDLINGRVRDRTGRPIRVKRCFQRYKGIPNLVDKLYEDYTETLITHGTIHIVLNELEGSYHSYRFDHIDKDYEVSGVR